MTELHKELLKNKLFTLKRKDEDEYTEALLLYYNPDIKKRYFFRIDGEEDVILKTATWLE